MAEITALAQTLAPGSFAVILVLLIVIAGLLRKVVHIPDDNYVPRELYEASERSGAEWKAIAQPAVQTAKETADQLATLTDLNEQLMNKLLVK